mmetsp:Transcript_65901/g.176584  ORF Transcript_65901/g.176584 Transcript_65901/m.176584 type:complete len:223 (-) Transcript_65901:509-1177(-)
MLKGTERKLLGLSSSSSSSSLFDNNLNGKMKSRSPWLSGFLASSKQSKLWNSQIRRLNSSFHFSSLSTMLARMTRIRLHRSSTSDCAMSNLFSMAARPSCDAAPPPHDNRDPKAASPPPATPATLLLANAPSSAAGASRSTTLSDMSVCDAISLYRRRISRFSVSRAAWRAASLSSRSSLHGSRRRPTNSSIFTRNAMSDSWSILYRCHRAMALLMHLELVL